MPKTLTGVELQLDDAPARESELFLVDGNNLAYRAFFALPEELATSDGFSTNALLGFTNMLFKLLTDYRPKGVAVAWDTRPVHRTEISDTYKADRRPMPDLLREQFPYFRPIVEAFGYRNLEFEGWEADDVIATLATRADAAGVKTCVVSTDRDAFQLVSENVCLMMTPRGVSDVNVYTPERVELRYGIPPDRVPDFIGLKGDTSDQIAGVPGIGDKTAGQLIAQFGSLENLLDSIDEVSGAKRKETLRLYADQARQSKLLATMRRDLDIDFDPAELVRGQPDRSALKEMFRRFEFRNLLQRVDELDSALPAAPVAVVGVEMPWREELPLPLGEVGVAFDDDRIAVAAGDDGRGRAAARPRRGNARRPRREGGAASTRRRHDAARLPDRARPSVLRAGRARRRVRDRAPSRSRGRGGDGRARPPRRRHAPAARTDARACPGARRRGAVPQRRVAALGVLAAMERAGVKIDTYRMGEITARLADRVEELETQAYELAGEEFMLGSTQQVARILFEKLELTPGRKGKTGYSTDTRVLRSIRDEHPIVPVIEEWREYSKLLNTYLGPLPSLLSEEDGRLHTTFNQAVAATGRLSTSNPNLQSIPIRTELGREIRSAFVAEPGSRLLSADYSQIELRILAHVSGEPKLREAFARGDDIHTATAAEVLGKDPAS